MFDIARGSCVRFALSLLLTSPSVLQGQAADGRARDLSFVATQIPARDPFFFAQLSSSDFQQAVDKLGADAPALSDPQFYVRLAQLVAMAGDAHTSIYLSGAPGFQTLPLHLRWLDDGVFVTSAGPEYARALGAKLIGVGDYPLDEVMKRLGTVIPHENDQWLHYAAQTSLVQQQTLQGLGLAPEGSPTPMNFESLDGSQFTLLIGASNETRTSLIGSDTGTIPDYLQNTSQNYWFSYSAANRLLYFKYNVCANDPAQPFPAFASSVLTVLDTNPVDTLVFDFRGNTGGDSSIINPLFNGVTQRLSRLRANAAFALYVAIDKGTISSGMDDAELFRLPGLNGVARVIGEPTGGKPAHFGNVSTFNLPGSGIPGQNSTQYFSAPSGVAPTDAYFEPDIPISIRSTDYFARFDPVMGGMLARAHGTVAAPASPVTTVNAASYRTGQGVAPGSFAAAFGDFSAVPDGVLVAGIAGQVVAATASQVNFIVPAAIAPGNARVSVQAAGAEIASGTVTIAPSGPGIFVLQPANPEQPGAIENADYAVNGASHPASAGAVMEIYATGYGGDALPVQVYFGDAPAEVLYSGSITPGLWQINTRVPAGLSGLTPVFLVAGGMVSNAVTVVLSH